MTARYPVGGIRTFLRYVYSQPVFEDYEITLLAPSEDLGEFLARYIPARRVRVQNILGAPHHFLGATRAALNASSFDLLHSHGLSTAVLGEIARTGTGIPHLMTMHDVFLPTTFKGLRGRVQQLSLNTVIRRCDAIHTVSKDCAENFLEYVPLVKRERVHPILNGIDTDAILRATPVDAHAVLGLPSDTRLIGFFGRFMAQKGFRTLVDAVQILAHVEDRPSFRIVTFGWGGFIREDFQYLESKGLGEYFIQQPHTDEPYSWMKSMDVIAMPSRWEACGLVAMEALTAGVPLVASDCIGLREVLSGTPARIVQVGDVASLAGEIMSVIREMPDTALTKFQAEAAKRYSIDGATSMLQSLCNQVARRT